jgi:hypothetical protein
MWRPIWRRIRRNFAAHLSAIAGFAEVRLVDRARKVTRFVAAGNELISVTAAGEIRLKNPGRITAFLADLPRPSAGPAADLDAMRAAMENDVTARVTIGGRVAGYSGTKPGVLQEALLSLQKNHTLFPLGGFGGAARDAAVALGLLQPMDRLKHPETGPGYQETVSEIGRFAVRYREAAQATDSWTDLMHAARAEDPEDASRNVLRGLIRNAPMH